MSVDEHRGPGPGSTSGNRPSARRDRTSGQAPSAAELVTVYWRPGCRYCASLRRGLRRAGLVASEVNIWTDRAAAATVRSLAGGNETVPTVVVGGQGLVNPPVGMVLGAVRAVAPGLIADHGPASSTRRTNLLQAVQWMVIVALVVAGFAVEAAGHAAASWAIDGAAAAIYVGFRVVRRRLEGTSAPRASTGRGPS
ncbi:MAG: glutaredoxin domain-containing protein [Acidimicrobiales bacterium]